MKTYFTIIKNTQQLLLAVSIGILAFLPLVIAFSDASFMANATLLYGVAHLFAFFVMMVRPLADIFTRTKLIRPLVILRKGAGVFSASIVISFLLAKMVIDPFGYPSSMITARYWSMENFALLAHLADISAILLLVTSNNLSKRLLGPWWKRIQRLSYVYFFSSALFVYLSYGTISVVYYMYLVAFVTILAFIINSLKRYRLNTQNI